MTETDLRELLHDLARSLNEYDSADPAPTVAAPASNGEVRPGDDYDRKASWRELLTAHGWSLVRTVGSVMHWRRPGKEGKGCSATTGKCRNGAGVDMLYVFSSNAPPLEPGRCYTPFRFFAALDCHNDFSEAARRLGRQGYGSQNGHAPRTVPFVNGFADDLDDGEVPLDEANEIAADRARITTIADLRRAGAEVRWAWPLWIPIGVLTALAGPAGCGKTRLCCDWLRRVRSGMSWPDGSPMTLPADSTSLWVMADNHHDQIVQLSHEFGLEETLYINSWNTEPYGGIALDDEEDYKALKRRMRALRPAFVFVDTVGNSTDKNLNRQEDARAYYAPLQVLAREFGCSIICITHFNAGGIFLGRRVLEKVRTAIQISRPDPATEKRRLEVHKTFDKVPLALGVVMADIGNEYDDQPPEKLEEETSRIGGKPGPVPARLEAASAWLRDQLQAGPKRVSYTRDDAETAGYDSKLLYRAMRLLKVEEYETQGRKWWRLPSDTIPD